MRAGISIICSMYSQHLGQDLAPSMNPTQVGSSFIHHSLIIHASIHSFIHILPNSINNLVEILGWEGENNVCSILSHSYRRPDLLCGLPGHSNSHKRVGSDAAYPEILDFHCLQQTLILADPLTTPAPSLRSLPAPGRLFPALEQFCPPTLRRLIGVTTTVTIQGPQSNQALHCLVPD